MSDEMLEHLTQIQEHVKFVVEAWKEHGDEGKSLTMLALVRVYMENLGDDSQGIAILARNMADNLREANRIEANSQYGKSAYPAESAYPSATLVAEVSITKDGLSERKYR